MAALDLELLQRLIGVELSMVLKGIHGTHQGNNEFTVANRSLLYQEHFPYKLCLLA